MEVKQTTEEKSAMCDNHDFVEGYYGWTCKKCGLFFPNTAPLGAWINGIKNDGYDE